MVDWLQLLRYYNNMYSLDDSDEIPLEFTEILGENRLTDDVRRAYIWASLIFFSDKDHNLQELVEPDLFSEQDKALAKSVSFRGPYFDHEKAEKEATSLLGIVCAPLHKWTVVRRPVWVVCLSN